MTYRLRLAAAGILLVSTTACVPLVAGGAAAGGVAVAQERSFGTAIDDKSIGTQIWSKYLQSDTQNLYSNVGIEVTEGRVLLTGPVATQDSAARAVQLAWEVPGVTEVINELQVTERGGVGTLARDSWITAQIKSRLIAEKGVRSINYTIETVNGVVYIMGIAQSEAELARVLNVASRVKGVRQVISHARMKDDPLRKGATNGTQVAPVQPAPAQQQRDYRQDQGYTQDYGTDEGYTSEFTPQYQDDTGGYQDPAPIESRELEPQVY